MTDSREHGDSTPGIELEGEVFWPDYEPGHLLREPSMSAFLEVTGLDSLLPGGRPSLPSTATLVLQVGCLPELHPIRGGATGAHRGPPVLAEVWSTSFGPLFLASVPGRRNDDLNRSPGEQTEGLAARTEMPRDDARKGDDPVPATVVRVLLENPTRPRRLQVKCRLHGQAWVDSAAIHRQALQTGKRSSSRRSRVVSLAEVRAVE